MYATPDFVVLMYFLQTEYDSRQTHVTY